MVTLQQLRFVHEIVRQGNHLSAAAQALYTSQPGVSRQVQRLEAELGFAIFLRTRNRIVGLTEPGQQVVEVARRVLADVDGLDSLKDELRESNRGTLTIATTHTQAKYTLPKVIAEFAADYPNVQIILKQGDPESICELVESGEADLAIGTETRNAHPNLGCLPCFDLSRSVVAPVGHPILDVEELTLQALANYPIITYDRRYSGHWKTKNAFERAGLEPSITLSAVDADVCKTYVRLGLGIGVLTSITFEASRDEGLQARDASHLFDSSTTAIKLRLNTYLRGYTIDFVRRFAPHIDVDAVRKAVRAPQG